MSKVKICGLTCEADVSYVNEAKADYAGFVLFFPKSKRCVSMEEAVMLKKRLLPEIRAVAVTVSPTKEELLQIQESGFDIVQIHGEWCAEEAETFLKIPVWRAFQIGPDMAKEQFEQKLKALDEYPYAGIVLDGYRYGGGEVFDWTTVKEYTSVLRTEERILIMAGGLNPENVGEGIRYLLPDVADVSSGVELGRDIRGKSRERVLSFTSAVRAEVPGSSRNEKCL